MSKTKKNDHMREWGYKLLRPILGPIFKLYYRPKIIGKEVIPKTGPVILAGNHKHILDQCLAIISTSRTIHYMAKREYFDGPFAWFFLFVGAISVDRSVHDEEAKKCALDILNSGLALGIFPEGTRNKTEELLLPFKMGAVSLAKKSDATIVPFAIKGDYKFFHNELRIIYGQPFKVDEFSSLKEANEHLYDTISTILKDDSL